MKIPALASTLWLLISFGAAFAQGATSESKSSDAATASAPARVAAAAARAAPAAASIAAHFGDWALVCAAAQEKAAAPCSLVQALVQETTKKRVFRLMVAYAKGGELVLAFLAPAGVDLKRGIELSLGSEKLYRAAFQSCLPRGCRAFLRLNDELRQELNKAEKGSIAVYASNGRAVRASPSFAGFGKGLDELQKRRGQSG